MRSVAVAAFLVLGCGVERLDAESSGACIPAPVQAVLQARCADQSGCHGATPTPQVTLDLRSPASSSIVGAASTQGIPLVELGNPDGSYLVQKIRADPAVGDRMPPRADFDDPALQADLSLVVAWVAAPELSSCNGADTSGGTSGSTGESGSDGPVDYLGCGLEELSPGATSPIVAGDGPDELPTEIGFLLANSCGCHYAEPPFSRMVPSNVGDLDMTTLASWRAPAPPAMTQTLLQLAATQLADSTPGGMPPPLAPCDIGNGEAMPPAERARLLQWMQADGPDGASWPP